MKNCKLVHKIQPDAVQRKRKDAKLEYEKLKRKVDLRKGAVAPDQLPPKVKVENVMNKDGFTGVLSLLKENIKDEKLTLLCVRSIADEAREAMLPLYEKKSSAFNAYADKYAEPDNDRAMRIGAKGGTRLLCRVVRHHINNKQVVLRCCWALEYVLLCEHNREMFNREGGNSVLSTIETKYRDKDVAKSLKKIRGDPEEENAPPCCSVA